jgi:two-component system, NarL family, sensor kinase
VFDADHPVTGSIFHAALHIQDEERQRIAQELHDSTAQHLAAAGLNVIALRGAKDLRSSEVFDDIESSLDAASRELRAFTYLLNPPELASDGLGATLGRYVEGFRRRTGLSVGLRVSGVSDQLSAPLQQSFLRIIQEALANVHRHAAASRATVKLTKTSSSIHLVISDDGRGLAVGESSEKLPREMLPTGVGVAAMAARARQFGGTLDIRSKYRGTSVHVVVPLRSAIARLS